MMSRAVHEGDGDAGWRGWCGSRPRWRSVGTSILMTASRSPSCRSAFARLAMAAQAGLGGADGGVVVVVAWPTDRRWLSSYLSGSA